MEADIIARYQQLYSALVSDCAEAAGLGVCSPAPGLQPFHTDPLRVAVGPAFPCFVRRTTERVEIDKLLAMVEATPTDVMAVVAVDQDVQGALWGGLMSASTAERGGVGAVVDGGVRDLHTIVPLGFPVWALYRSPLDIRGRGEVVEFGEPVVFRGTPVAPGDLVFADANGVVVVPQRGILEVLERCEERVGKEILTEQELRAGATPTEVYARHQAF